MTFKWRLLQQVAVQLLGLSASEHHTRSAINRAYYAAYGEARNFAEQHGYVWNGKGGSHIQVWQFIRLGKGTSQKWQLAAWRAVGDAGLALKESRTRADYRSAPAPGAQEARQAVAQAQNIINRLHGLP